MRRAWTTRHDHRTVWLVPASLVAALGTAGCTIDIGANEYSVREEKRFVLEGDRPPEIELVTFDGAVEVRSWDRREVRVEVEKAGAARDVVEAIAVKATHEDGRIRVEVVPSSTGGWMADLVASTSHRARISASVPQQCNLLIRTGDGGVKVEGVEGRLEVETADGSIRGVGLVGDVDVRTGDGTVKLQPVDGRVTVDTPDGAIILGGRLRGLTAKTGDGSIAIRLDEGSRPEADWYVTTLDGGISIELPAQFDAEIDALTGDGLVRADRALGLAGHEKPGRALRARVGDGGRVIVVRSSDGSISLRRP